VERLRGEGHKVHYVAEMERGIQNEDVLSRATREKAILLTTDKDFGDLVFRQGLASQGVILLRVEGLSSPAKARLVAAALAKRGADFQQNFTVISPKAIRVRRTAR